MTISRDTGKKRCGDRLSHLPEPLVYHILSFLDTKSAVQTSVLSRSWRCAWKHVLVLNFHQGYFQLYSSFHMYVDKVLCLRYPLNLHKVRFVDDELRSEGRNDLLVIRVIRYALSRDTQHLAIATENDLITPDIYRFSDLFGWSSSCNLKTLKLRGFDLDVGFGSPRFRMLTTLKVVTCIVACGDEEVFEPFSNFPCLKHLVVTDCLCCDTDSQRCIKIYGLQLLSLQLERAEFEEIDIYAPKLEFFSFFDYVSLIRLSDLSLPPLDYADIGFNKEKQGFVRGGEKELIMLRLISMFQCLHNAKSLKLDEGALQLMSEFRGVWEDQPSPFTSLKSLIVDSGSVPVQSEMLNKNVIVRTPVGIP